MTRAFIGGIGLCAPGLDATSEWLTTFPGITDSGEPSEVLPAALRRRASPLTRMAATVAAQAARQAGLDLARVPLVLGSAYGEIVAAAEMIRSFGEDEGLPSPTRFHNSVHNTAAAYLSMATGNRGFSTALAAGSATPAAVVLEALAWLRSRGGEALLVLLDELPPAPFDLAHPYPTAAVALHVSAEPTRGTLAVVSGLRRGIASRPDLPGGLGAHPCAGAFAMAAAVARGQRGALGLGAFDEDGWLVDVDAVRVG